VKILRSEAVLRGEGAGLKILGAQAAASMLNECLQCHGPGAEELAHWPTVRAILTEWNMSRVLDTSFAARIRPQLSGTDEQINTCLRTLEQVVADYEHMKQRSHTYDFDDLLVQPVRLLEGNAEVLARWQGRFQHILVDEYQDTNAMQERLVALLSNRSHLTVVGDNAQSIYSWRGSDSRLIEYFPLKFDPSRTFKVETNYRSSPQIIALANRIEKRMAQEGLTTGPQKILQAHRADGSAPLWLRCQTPLEEAAAIANHISDWLNGGGSPGDVAILFRAHFQVHHLQLELARRAIPYRIMGANLKHFQHFASSSLEITTP
jgi:DNA helicase-2/ATP-dependent DNA helicase PcrA